MVLCGALMAGTSLMSTSCKNYDDDIQSLGDRVTAVEGDLASLKQQIESGAVISSVTPSENGITITLSDGQKYEIKNGAKGDKGDTGATGQDGKPGSVVEIGSNGNWVIDGVDTEKPSRGEAGPEGTPGVDGDTIYYYPGTEGKANGYWVKVEIDGATGQKPETITSDTWLPAGGTLTAVYDTETGSLCIYNAEGTEEGQPIRISLFGVLKSIAFVPEVIDTNLGMGVIDFYSIIGEEGDFIKTTDADVTYRMNPQNAKVSTEMAEWEFINRVVETRVMNDNTSLLSINAIVPDGKGGLVFTVAAKDDLDALKANEEAIVALHSVTEDIVSDYAAVAVTELSNFSIIDTYHWEESETAKAYPTSLPALDEERMPDATFKYDSTLDLNDIVLTYENEELQDLLSAIGIKVEYTFTKVDEYLGEDGTTDQQKFVTIDDNGVVSVNSEWLDNGGTAAVGRTPVFKAEATVDGITIATAYIKVEITEDVVAPEEKGDLEVDWTLEDIEYTTINASRGETFEYAWDLVNSDILDELGLTAQNFKDRYEAGEVEGEYEGVLVIFEDPSEYQTSTPLVTVNVRNTATFGKKNITITYPAKNNFQDKNIVINLSFEITHKTALPTLSEYYLVPGTDDAVAVAGKLVEGKFVLESDVLEHFTNYLADYEAPDNHLRDEMKVEILPGYLDFALNGTNVDDQTIAMTTEFAVGEAYKACGVKLSLPCVNGEECTMEYEVRFTNPFIVTIDEMTLKTITAQTDQVNVEEYVTITDVDGDVIYEEGAFTDAAATKYNITADSGVTFTYSLDKTLATGDKLTIEDSTITWGNGNNVLQSDITSEKAVVEINIPQIGDYKATGDITILSTENSKN